MTYSKQVVQFAIHGGYLRDFDIRINRWSKYLREQQADEVSLFVAGHKGAEIGILPEGKVLPEQSYGTFFRRAREFKWIEF